MNYLLILLAVSMLVSGLGWIYFIYFFSIGYGFSVSALAVTIAILFKDVMTLPTVLLCAVMFIFGCRLGLYLLTREKRSPEYKKILYGPDAAKKKPLFVVIMVWIFCALLYVGQVSPVAFFLANKASGAPVKRSGRTEKSSQEDKQAQIRRHGSVQTGTLPELSWRACHMDGVLYRVLRSLLYHMAVDYCSDRIHRYRICDVQWSPQT